MYLWHIGTDHRWGWGDSGHACLYFLPTLWPMMVQDGTCKHELNQDCMWIQILFGLFTAHVCKQVSLLPITSIPSDPSYAHTHWTICFAPVIVYSLLVAIILRTVTEKGCKQPALHSGTSSAMSDANSNYHNAVLASFMLSAHPGINIFSQ